MNILNNRWTQIKEGLIPFLFVTFSHIWWLYNYPNAVKIETGLALLANFLIFAFYASIFFFPEIYAWKKKKYRTNYMLPLSLAPMFFYYKNFYGMPLTYSILCYVNCFIIGILVTRAINR